MLISQNGMTAGSCQRARSASGSLYGSRTWTRPLERWSSLNTRPELAEAARRLRQLSHSQRAQLSMRGSQSVRSLRIGFSWARALVWWNARAASAAHRQLSIDGLAASQRATVALRWVRADQRAAYTLQLRGYNAGAGSPTHEWALLGPDPIGWCRPGLPQATPTGERAPQPPA